MANLIQWLSDRLGLSVSITIALFIAALFIPAAAVIIVGRDLEVDYSVSPVFSLCGKLPGKPIAGVTLENCETMHEMKLANMGSQEQSLITVDLPVVNVTVGDVHTQELIASNAPSAPVDFKASDLPGEYTIKKLPPNTMMIVKLQTTGLSDARALAHEDTKVQASGRVLNVDPQSAAVIRVFYALLGVLGL